MPKGDLVLAKVAEAEEKTTGGILLPGSAQVRRRSGAACMVAATARWATPAVRGTHANPFLTALPCVVDTPG